MPPEGHNAVDIEFLQCAFCFLDLDSLSISQREAHYEDHFINDLGNGSEGSQIAPIVVEPVAEPPTSSKGRMNTSEIKRDRPKKKFQFVKETDVFWYPAQETPPPSSCTPGLINLLRKGLLRGHSRGNIRRAALCFDKTVHIHREIWDAGWGCGYRNFLMACGGLMSQMQQPLYFPLLDSPLPPGIRNLQSWIETAWKEGFDPEGRKDLQKLVGTHKWIGTADLWVAFVSRGIPVQLVDFDLRNQAREILINWVVNYFTPKKSQDNPANLFESLKISPVTSTDKMPLILQHDGHSRTVVGYEVDRNGITNLLVFDPAHRPNAEVRNLALAEFAKSRLTQASTSPTFLDSQSTSSYTPMASPSTLKRKRSINDSSQNGEVLKQEKIARSRPKLLLIFCRL
ncbi:peptidase family C78-domain-containing protein [Flammula alnicola]|nr:peptidase family C78-domain-containing protein [Flammula alnicola]